MNAFEKPLDEIYRKLKLYFYREMALHTNREDNGLSITESFCMESIYALDHPTIAQFANFMNISSPNATYKIHHLIAKGYLEKIQSPRSLGALRRSRGQGGRAPSGGERAAPAGRKIRQTHFG